MFANLFQHWGFWLAITLVVMVFLLAAQERGFRDKLNGSIDGQKFWLGFKAEWLEKNFSRVMGAVAIAGVVLMVLGCSGGRDEVLPPVAVDSNCQGSYVGSYGPPEHDERIRLRNLSLANRGIAVTGNDDIDNAAAGGGPPDGGIWMGGSYAFETDANCNVVKGKTLIFYAYEYDIGGTVGKDGTFNLTWSGQGSAGEMRGKVDAIGNITGQFFHPAPDNFVYGVLSGTFTPVAVK
jgi:hypothetical protein